MLARLHRRGHRTRAHTADVIVEAWGPSRVACLEEAVLGLVDTFAETPGTLDGDERALELPPADDAELLVGLLDEVVYVVDAFGVVPADVRLDERADGGLSGHLVTVPVAEVEATGAAPKGVSRSDLVMGRRRGRWRCRVEIDV